MAFAKKMTTFKKEFTKFLTTVESDLDMNLDVITKWVEDYEEKKIVKREEKDPNRVKKPVPASWMWRNENREKIQKEYFDGENVKGSLISKKAQEIWKEMSDEEKRPYEERRAELWEEYKASNPTSTTSTPRAKETFEFDEDEEVETPENWEGPHNGKFLKKYACGKKIGTGRFATFEEAIAAANENSECGGITRGKNGYTLRKGFDPMTDTDNDKNGPFTSWTKKDYMPETTKKTNKKSKKKSKKESVKKDADPKAEVVAETDIKKSEDEKEVVPTSPIENKHTDLINTSGDEEDEDENEDTNNGATKEDTYENETENDSENEDSDDEDALAVSPWEHDGQTYFLDENTNMLYDSETHEEVGKRKKGKNGWKIIKN